MVNRTWAQLFGRGIVNPVDDMLAENEPSHPELLDALARHFAKPGGFDVKYLVQGHLPQRGLPADQQADRRQQGATSHLFSHMSDEGAVAGAAVRLAGAGHRQHRRHAAGREPKARARARPVGARDQFVNFFLAGQRLGQPDRVRGRHPAGAAADELADRQQPGCRPRRSPAAAKPGRGDREALPGRPVPPARRPTRQPMLTDYVAKRDLAGHGLRRHPLGRAQRQRVHAESLTLVPVSFDAASSPDATTLASMRPTRNTRHQLHRTRTVTHVLLPPARKTRRDFLKLSAAGVFAPVAVGWLPVLADAAQSGSRARPGPSRASCCGWTAGPATRTPST